MPKPRRLRDQVVLFVKGAAVGAAQIVPGVSGGTLALVLGIYQELLDSIGAATRRPFLRALATGKFRNAYRTINGPFLVTLSLGIAVAVLLLSGLLGWLLEKHQSLILAFFFGLVLASIVAVGRRVAPWNGGTLAFALMGAVAGFVVVGLTPAETPGGFLVLALSGALAVCALVLPGISGAFILVLLGHYNTALVAISTGDLRTLAPFAMGAVVGLLSFARLLSWLLTKAYGSTLALLTGFMLGSLRKLWPWQLVDEGSGVNMPPPSLAAALVAILLGTIGAAAVVAIDWWARES